MSIPSRVYIQNFPRNITIEQLQSILLRHASVEVISKSKNKGKKAKPYAYVSVRSQDDLQRLLEAKVTIRGHHLNIKEYKSEKELKAFRHSEIRKRVFINNIPLGTEEGVVRKAVERFGSIKILKMAEKEDGLTARITFDSQTARDLCLTKGRIQLTPKTSVTVEEQRIYERKEDLDSFERMPEFSNRTTTQRKGNASLHCIADRPIGGGHRMSTRALQAPRSYPQLGTTSLQNIAEAQQDWFSSPKRGLFRTRKLLIKESGSPVRYDYSQYRFNKLPRGAECSSIFEHSRAPNVEFGGSRRSIQEYRATSEPQTLLDKSIHSR